MFYVLHLLTQYDYMFREAGLASYITRLHRSLPKYSPYTIFHYACQHLSAQATHGPIRRNHIISPSSFGITVAREEVKGVRLSKNHRICKNTHA
jgi:hypothetical protein